jgi:hypothetical protein
MGKVRVTYEGEDGTTLPTWEMEGRPLVGDQLHRNYGPDGTWEVITVQHSGTMQFRCICKKVAPQ